MISFSIMTTTKKNKKETYKLILSEEQLGIVQTALEAYSRMKMGQIGYGIMEIFPSTYPETTRSIEGFVRNVINYEDVQRGREPTFPSDSNASWGYGHEKSGDGSEAFVIMQAVRQFLAVKRNDGYFDPSFVTYDDPMTFGREDKHIPEIEGFIKYKDYYLDDQIKNKEAVRLFRKEQYAELYNDYFNKDFTDSKGIMGEKYQIMLDRHEENIFLRVFKPSKIKNYKND